MTKRPTLIVLHGANLDLLGERPAGHYGTITLRELEDAVTAEAARNGWDCSCYQTNHEGHFIEYLHQFRHADAILVNPGAWTHYSYAIRDALEIVSAPVAEVHLSDITSREVWRRRSVISEVVSLSISGKGLDGYLEAVRQLVAMRQGEDETHL
ncbi:MAG: 3-dehydroquinate dehydratase [Actinobacteria bacterium]|nr:3-dehydroquinate dehydratase [Actinomycetota bacterium]